MLGYSGITTWTGIHSEITRKPVYLVVLNKHETLAEGWAMLGRRRGRWPIIDSHVVGPHWATCSSTCIADSFQ